MVVKIECKKCGSVEEHGGTTMIALETFDENTEVKGWTCGKCVNKIEKENIQFKAEFLAFKIQKKEEELAKLVSLVKNKIITLEGVFGQYFGLPPSRIASVDPNEKLREWLETLLTSQKQCLQEPNISAREQLGKAKEILRKKLTGEEIDGLLGKQIEINELEKQLENLQNQQFLVEQSN